MKKLVYADNAATTKLDDEAFEAMKPYLAMLHNPIHFQEQVKKL